MGGIKEKVLAALRAGIHDVILPAENERDLAELAPAVRQRLRSHLLKDAGRDPRPRAAAAPAAPGPEPA